MTPKIVEGFVILRFQQGQWIVQPTKLFETYDEANEWVSKMYFIGIIEIVPVRALLK